jgi:hypothetical protein
VGGASGGKGVVTGTSTNVHTNGGSLSLGLFSADADAIFESCHLEWTVHLQWLRDLTAGQVTEVGGSWALRELKESLGLSQLGTLLCLSFDKIIGPVLLVAEAPGGGSNRSVVGSGDFLNALRDL